MKNMIKYMTEVLGVKTAFAHPTNSVDLLKENNSSFSQIKLFIGVENLSSYSTEEKDLLDKMLQAMKLPESDYLVVDSKKLQKIIADSQSTSVLSFYFVDQIKDQNIETYSPRKLLHHPEFKKDAWAFMQSFLKKMNSN